MEDLTTRKKSELYGLQKLGHIDDDMAHADLHVTAPDPIVFGYTDSGDPSFAD